MTNPFEEYFRSGKDFLLHHRYRRVGMWICLLAIPAVVVLNRVLRLVFNLGSEYWIEWGLYMMHLPLSLGLYLILFSEEKQEDEFYLSLRLRAVARGVVMVVTATALLPVIASIRSLFLGGEAMLPDVGGNMAVCTVLLIYANAAYFYNKSRMVIDD